MKEGNVEIKYDTRFVFAEVNADTVYWKREKAGGSFKPFQVNRKAIGKLYLTAISLDVGWLEKQKVIVLIVSLATPFRFMLPKMLECTLF